MTDHYEEYLEAGVMPGKEDEFLLTDEEVFDSMGYHPITIAEAATRTLINWLEEHNLLKAKSEALGLALGAGDWERLKKFKDK